MQRVWCLGALPQAINGLYITYLLLSPISAIGRVTECNGKPLRKRRCWLLEHVLSTVRIVSIAAVVVAIKNRAQNDVNGPRSGRILFL